MIDLDLRGYLQLKVRLVLPNHLCCAMAKVILQLFHDHVGKVKGQSLVDYVVPSLATAFFDQIVDFVQHTIRRVLELEVQNLITFIKLKLVGQVL